MGPDRCESCGAAARHDNAVDHGGTDDSQDIVNVQRLYLVALPDGTVGNAQKTVHGDIEAWCFVCRTMYPHEPV